MQRAGKSACVQQHDEITPAWLLNLYGGVPSEAAGAQGSQLSGLLPQTGILSTWQTPTSGVTLKSHAAIQKKSLSHSFPPSLAPEKGDGGRSSDFWRAEESFVVEVVTDLRAAC